MMKRPDQTPRTYRALWAYYDRSLARIDHLPYEERTIIENELFSDVMDKAHAMQRCNGWKR